jgi:hypothetical protein
MSSNRLPPRVSYLGVPHDDREPGEAIAPAHPTTWHLGAETTRGPDRRVPHAPGQRYALARGFRELAVTWDAGGVCIGWTDIDELPPATRRTLGAPPRPEGAP